MCMSIGWVCILTAVHLILTSYHHYNYDATYVDTYILTLGSNLVLFTTTFYIIVRLLFSLDNICPRPALFMTTQRKQLLSGDGMQHGGSLYHIETLAVGGI